MSAVPQPYAQPYGAAAYGAGYGMGMPAMQQGAFYGTVQHGDAVVDRYVVPGETMHIPEPVPVQSVTTVMENQMYMEPKQVTVKVPRTVMEDFEVQYQVPAMESRFHTAQRPKVVMEEQTITVNEPRTVMEPVQIQVPHVQTVQAIQMHHKVVEYERPRMIPGRMVRAYAGPTQTVGYTQGQTYAAQQMTGTIAQPIAYGGVTQTVAQPIAYGYGQTVAAPLAAPMGMYGTYGTPMYGAATFATPAAARPSTTYQPPADDAISA